MKQFQFNFFSSVIAAFSCLSLLMPSPAIATGGVSCTAPDGTADIHIGMGRVPIYAPFSAVAQLYDKVWMSVPVDGELELGESQGLMRNDKLSVDFTDPQALKIIISLDVDYSGEERDDGFPGKLTFEDGIPRDVFCLFE